MNRHANIEKFVKLDKDIERHEHDAEAARWEQARLAAEAVADGMSQADYAREVGKDRTHISRLCRLWKKYGSDVSELTSRPSGRHRRAVTPPRSSGLLTVPSGRRRG